jgi:Tfp pilus assembly protein PilF
VRLDPKYPWAWSALASARLIAARFGYAEDGASMLAAAEAAARRAIELDPQLPVPHATLGLLHLVRREFDAAEAAGRRAVALGPSNSEIHAILAQTVFFRGRFDEAVTLSRQAVRLSPRHPSWYLIWEAWGRVSLGDTSGGLAAARRMLDIAESSLQRAVAHDSIAFAHADAGRLEEARAAVAARGTRCRATASPSIGTRCISRTPRICSGSRRRCVGLACRNDSGVVPWTSTKAPAARFIDLMEQDRIIGPGDGAKPRQILVGPDYLVRRPAAR